MIVPSLQMIRLSEIHSRTHQYSLTFYCMPGLCQGPGIRAELRRCGPCPPGLSLVGSQHEATNYTVFIPSQWWKLL